MASPRDLIDARLAASLTASEAAKLTGRNVRAWRRMERGETKIDLACLRLIEALSGDLTPVHTDWAGWRLCRDGKLYMPGYRQGLTPADIMRLPWLWQLASPNLPHPANTTPLIFVRRNT